MENSITNNNETSMEIIEENNIVNIETKSKDNEIDTISKDVENKLVIELPKEKKPMTEKKRMAFEKMQQKRIENATIRKELKKENVKTVESPPVKTRRSAPLPTPDQSEDESSDEEIIYIKSKKSINKKKKKIVVYETSSDEEDEAEEVEQIKPIVQQRQFTSHNNKKYSKQIDYSHYFA